MTGTGRSRATPAGVLGLVLVAALGAVLTGGGVAPAAPARATAALPSFFDGCAYLTADDVHEVTGVTVEHRTQGAPGPEDAAAAACSYTGSAAGDPISVAATIWTKTSADQAGLDFGDLAGFTGDYPLDLAAKTPVAGLGDEAWYAPQSGGGVEHALLVRRGELRLLLLGGGASVENADQLARLATLVLGRLAENPPPPDPAPVAGSLAPPVPHYQFGNGRALFVDPNGSTASLRALVGTRITGRRVFFNGDVPDELDLRALSVVDVAGTTTAVLQFSAPVTVRTTFDGTPVEHRTMIVLRSPLGDALGVAIGPDGAGVALRDPLGAATVTGQAAVLFSGTWAVLDIPASFGVTADWTVQAVVRVEAPGGFPYGRTVTGWQLTTVPVTVGSLTGGTGITLPADGANVPSLPSAAALGDDRTTTFAPVALPPTMAARSIAIDTTGGHRRLVVTFASPPAAGGPLPGTNDAHATVTIGLAPTGPLSPGAPVELVWPLPAPGKPPGTAIVRGQDGRVAGVVPVTIAGSTARFDLDAYAPPAPGSPSTTTTTVPTGRPHGTLGTDTIEFREEVLLGADGCICPDGQPPADASSSERDVLEIQLAGPAIAITRRSTGTTAVGAIDSRTGQFVASNATEYWSGILTTLGGMIGRYARLVASAHTTGFVLPAANRTADPANPFGFLDPLGAINNQANRPNAGGGPAAADDPCWKIVNQTVYIGQGRMLIYQGGVPRAILPPTELGFDQNKFASTWDYQQWLNSQRWPDGACNQATSHTATRPTPVPLAAHTATRSVTQPLAASPFAARPSSPAPPALPGLADITDTWSLHLDTTITDDDTGNVLARQTTPSVQLGLLGGLRPSAANAPTTAPAATTPGAPTTATAAPPATTTTAAPRRATSSAPRTITIVLVAVVAVGAAAAAAISRTRRRRQRPGAVGRG